MRDQERLCGMQKRPRYNLSRSKRESIPIPGLIALQRKSYEDFLQKDVPADKREKVGLQGALSSFFPIKDFSEKIQLELVQYVLEEPKYDADEARQKSLTYTSALKVRLRLVIWEEKEGEKVIKAAREQETYLGDIPLMTEEGTFVINGVDRVVVSQMHRSPGVFFDRERGTSLGEVTARVIPSMGAWLDFEFTSKNVLCARIDRKRKILATTLLMALEAEDPEGKYADLPMWERPGMGRGEILSAFYESVSLTFFQTYWVLPFLPERWKNTRLSFDLMDGDTGQILAQKGERLTARMVRQFVDQGLRNFQVDLDYVIGAYLASDLINPETGEIYGAAGQEMTAEMLEVFRSCGQDQLSILDIDHVTVTPCLRNTLEMEKNLSREEALKEIYQILRPGETPSLKIAYHFFENLFFNPERYSLSEVGRLKTNLRLNSDIPLSEVVLHKKDFILIMRRLLDLREGRGTLDDIDSLGNRRVRSVGELLEVQYRAGLARMQRSVRERMSSVDWENAMPSDFLNARPLSSIIREFFGTSQLSQFMDQTNPLAEINHKRRLSALGPGGLTRDRAGIEVRDVNPTQYGRVCPIETPEGGNIGLINSMAVYARVNKYGFLETPYRRVVQGRVTQEVVYVSVMEEEGKVIAQASTLLDKDGYIQGEVVRARRSQDYVLVSPAEVDYIDVSPKQIVSVAASLIPFIENDDANRALMGSNMQRQTVPLVKPQAPLVGTGMEALVAKDSGAVVKALRDGVVDRVDARRIVVRRDALPGSGESVVDIYNLVKYRKSNAGTCIHQKPLVRVGQRVCQGDLIADGHAIDRGELALGNNALVAFMPWNGYGFEDSIIISKKLVREDAYTSFHIESFESVARDTRLGYEEVTRDLPGVSEEQVRNLDETGVVRIGVEVKPGDILVGKVSPKPDAPLTPEEKLLRSIFADKASDMKDSSLRVPSGMGGVVVDVQIFSRVGVERDQRALLIEHEKIAQITQDQDAEKEALRDNFKWHTGNLVLGQKLLYRAGTVTAGTVITAEIWTELERLGWDKIVVDDSEVSKKLKALSGQYEKDLKNLEKRFEEKVMKIGRGDEVPAGVLKIVKVFLAVKRKLQPGDKMAGRHGNKGVVSIIVPEEDMPYLADGTPVDIVLNSLGVPSRMNVGQVLETHLGWAALNFGKQMQGVLKKAALAPEEEGERLLRDGMKDLYQQEEIRQELDRMPIQDLIELAQETTRGMPVATPIFEGAKVPDIEEILKRSGVNSSGQEILFDGRTGQAFERPVTVGILYMLKLDHLVDNKIHARSVGPYSLVTQQPLGGKSQFGGQRFGEMEVWAVEAYGAAHVLSELLTVKSDDLKGRMEVYKSIIKGMEVFGSDVPESFNVLVKELQTLCLNIEYIQDAQDEIGELPSNPEALLPTYA